MQNSKNQKNEKHSKEIQTNSNKSPNKVKEKSKHVKNEEIPKTRKLIPKTK